MRPACCAGSTASSRSGGAAPWVRSARCSAASRHGRPHHHARDLGALGARMALRGDRARRLAQHDLRSALRPRRDALGCRRGDHRGRRSSARCMACRSSSREALPLPLIPAHRTGHGVSVLHGQRVPHGGYLLDAATTPVLEAIFVGTYAPPSGVSPSWVSSSRSCSRRSPDGGRSGACARRRDS